MWYNKISRVMIICKMDKVKLMRGYQKDKHSDKGDTVQMEFQYQIALSFATEDEDIVKKVYHYLKAEGISVFYAPAPECQPFLSGKNQSEIFYEVFGLMAEYAALFVSKSYIAKKVPMEEAGIAIAKHSGNGSVVPIYLDGSRLPSSLYDPDNTNYFKSDSPAKIAGHLAMKIKSSKICPDTCQDMPQVMKSGGNVMNIRNNRAKKQVFIQTVNGSIEL